MRHDKNNNIYWALTVHKEPWCTNILVTIIMNTNISVTTHEVVNHRYTHCTEQEHGA